jgi:hypothetical protein
MSKIIRVFVISLVFTSQLSLAQNRSWTYYWTYAGNDYQHILNFTEERDTVLQEVNFQILKVLHGTNNSILIPDPENPEEIIPFSWSDTTYSKAYLAMTSDQMLIGYENGQIDTMVDFTNDVGDTVSFRSYDWLSADSITVSYVVKSNGDTNMFGELRRFQTTYSLQGNGFYHSPIIEGIGSFYSLFGVPEYYLEFYPQLICYNDEDWSYTSFHFPNCSFITSLQVPANDNSGSKIVAIYTVSGVRINTFRQGVNIVQYASGKRERVYWE